MIEANPRLWGPSQLILDAGMDLFYFFAADNELINAVPKSQFKKGVKYFWSGGIIEDQLKGEMPVFHQYSASEFFKENAGWCKADLYTKSDTLKVYQKEVNR
jgi:hypothetical protein